MARKPLNGSPKITNRFKAPGWGSLGAHLGIDYGVPVGTPVYAPVGGTINLRQTTSGKGSGGKQLQLAGDDGKWHRFLHLNEQLVSSGQKVAEGQLIGRSGATGDVTGPHLHWDVRNANTTWNASLNNYVDPEAWVNSLNKPKLDMPAIGSWIQLIPTDKRTTFKVGTATQVGTINVKDNTYKYLVRGYDSKYPGRIIINSASAGGNGVGLALYYLNGQKIAGWRKV